MYPKPVIEATNEIVEVLGNDFFTDNEIYDIKGGKQILTTYLNKYLLERFLNGENLVFESEEMCSKILMFIITRCHLESLKQKGMIGIYEDDDNEEIIPFLTEKGKAYAKQTESRRGEGSKLYTQTGSIA